MSRESREPERVITVVYSICFQCELMRADGGSSRGRGSVTPARRGGRIRETRGSIRECDADWA